MVDLTKKKIVLVQGSLRQNSRTSVVITRIFEELKKITSNVEIVDLRGLELQFCDGRSLSEYNDDMRQADKTFSEADGFVIGMPVYQYSISGPLKNFLDIADGGMENKVTGIVCVSGSIRSYLAAADLQKVLSFEINCTTVQPIVHVIGSDLEGRRIVNPDIEKKIDGMIEELVTKLT